MGGIDIMLVMKKVDAHCLSPEAREERCCQAVATAGRVAVDLKGDCPSGGGILAR